MPTMDLDYDENRGNTARPDCPLSISREEDFFAAMARVMGYDEPEDGDDVYVIAAHLTFERLVRNQGRRGGPESAGQHPIAPRMC
eukprot:1186067-Prymnesium_polylepis.1